MLPGTPLKNVPNDGDSDSPYDSDCTIPESAVRDTSLNSLVPVTYTPAACAETDKDGQSSSAGATTGTGRTSTPTTNLIRNSFSTDDRSRSPKQSKSPGSEGLATGEEEHPPRDLGTAVEDVQKRNELPFSEPAQSSAARGATDADARRPVVSIGKKRRMSSPTALEGEDGFLRRENPPTRRKLFTELLLKRGAVKPKRDDATLPELPDQWPSDDE